MRRKTVLRTRFQYVTGDVQQQHVVGPTFREQLFDVCLDDVCGSVPHDLHGEVADLGVAEHPSERFGVHRRLDQAPHCLVLILVIGDDQSFPATAHCSPSPMACLLTNNSISRA